MKFTLHVTPRVTRKQTRKAAQTTSLNYVINTVLGVWMTRWWVMHVSPTSVWCRPIAHVGLGWPWSHVRRLFSLTLPNIAGFLQALRFSPAVTLYSWRVVFTGPLRRTAFTTWYCYPAPWPADNFKKYKIKHIPKNNVILKTQDMSQYKWNSFNNSFILYWLISWVFKMTLFFGICFILYLSSTNRHFAFPSKWITSHSNLPSAENTWSVFHAYASR